MQSQTLVPPGRLGALLIKQRTERGWTVADLAARSKVFSPLELDRLERGAGDLNDHDVEEVLRLYGLDLSNGTYGRSELVVDLPGGRIGVGETSLRFEGPTCDLVLERYVSLLYLLREQPVGSDLPLRSNDLETLSETLSRPQDRLITDLHSIMGDRRTVGRTRRLSRRRRVLQAGLLVGASLAGSLIIVGDFIPSASAAVVEAPEQRGTLVLERIGFDFDRTLPGWTLQWADDHPIYGGLTHASQRTITIHVDPAWSDDRLADILMHEIGHAIDLDHLDDTTRLEWLSMRNIENGWWTSNGLRDFDVGAGDFAEAVASASLGSDSDSHHGDFTDDQLDFVRTLLDRIAQNPTTSQNRTTSST